MLSYVIVHICRREILRQLLQEAFIEKAIRYKNLFIQYNVMRTMFISCNKTHNDKLLRWSEQHENQGSFGSCVSSSTCCLTGRLLSIVSDIVKKIISSFKTHMILL